MAVLTTAALDHRPAPRRLLHDRWTTVDGLRVFSRVSEAASAGDVPPIVHIHGFGISGRYMLPTATRLAADYPVHVPDLPGHGKSESPARLLGIAGLADALAGYLDAVDVSRAVLLGNSLGCLVAAEFAHRYPLPNGNLFQGFVAKSADKIFESTNRAAM